MREQKKHWFTMEREGRNWQMKGDATVQMPLCGVPWYAAKFANMKRKVTCLNCARILAGYQGEKK